MQDPPACAGRAVEADGAVAALAAEMIKRADSG